MKPIALFIICLLTFNAHAENKKYKRTDLENMKTHLQCMWLGNVSNLKLERIALHVTSSKYYAHQSYKNMSQEQKDGNGKNADDFLHDQGLYYKGFINGVISNPNVNANELYLAACQDDTLEFAETK